MYSILSLENNPFQFTAEKNKQNQEKRNNW